MNPLHKIPVFFRVPIALLADGVVAFGPIVGVLYLRPSDSSIWFLIGFSVLWLVIFQHFLLWRLDVFWNLRSMQNRTPKPAAPDNHRTFRTWKGWLGWLFMGKDFESQKTGPRRDDAGL